MASELNFGNQFVIFGEGSMVQFGRKRTEVDFEGRVIWIFLLRPSKDVIFKYRLNIEQDLDKQGLIVRRYPESVISVLDEDPNHARILVHTDLNNRPTPFSRLFEKFQLQIDMLEQINSAMKSSNARLMQELKMSSSSSLEYMQMMVNMINTAREANKQINRDDADAQAQEEFEE